MERRIVELYSDADLLHLRRKVRDWCAVHGLTAAAALAACVMMIVRTGTLNAAAMERAVILVSILAGWFILGGQIFLVTPWRRELRHAGMLRTGEREKVTGTVTVTDERIAIKGSITARRAEVRAEGETRRVLVCESRVPMLEAADMVTLYTVHHYAAAYEGAE